MAKTGYDALMHVACVEWGFCGCIKNEKPLHVDDLIPPEGPVSADQFVEWLFLADNMNPNAEPERWNKAKDALRAAFVKYMGSNLVDAQKLHWSFHEPEEQGDIKFRGHLPDAR